MFPTPIERTKPSTQLLYKIALPISIVIWLLPLIAVALTSIRSGADINSGNYWGMPTSINFVENYTAVFTDSPLGYYIFNSFKITIPTVIGALVLSSFTGFALGVYRFKLNLFVFFIFVAGNFIPFQILMVPVRDLSLSLGLYNSVWGLVAFHIAFQTGFCTFFMRNFIRALPYELIEVDIPFSNWRDPEVNQKGTYLRMVNPSTSEIHFEGVPNYDKWLARSREKDERDETILTPTVRAALAWRDNETRYTIPIKLT
jgi:hypothetical protein